MTNILNIHKKQIIETLEKINYEEVSRSKVYINNIKGYLSEMEEELEE